MMAQPVYFVVPAMVPCIDAQHFFAYGTNLVGPAAPMHGQTQAFSAFPTLLVGSAQPADRTQEEKAKVNQPREEMPPLDLDSADIWKMAQAKDGSREVQRMLDASTNDKERLAIAAAMYGRVWTAICCPNANHVLQKVIVTMRAQQTAFILSELMEGSCLLKATQHKYGCRVIQRLIEHSSASQLDSLVEALLPEAIPLCRHSYANFVVKALLQYGTRAHLQMIVKSLGGNLDQLGSGNYSCGVLYEALMALETIERLAFALTLAQEPGLLVRMSRSRQGHFVVKAVLEFLLEEGDIIELDAAREGLFANMDRLRETRYGRIILTRFGNSATNSYLKLKADDVDSSEDSDTL